MVLSEPAASPTPVPVAVSDAPGEEPSSTTTVAPPAVVVTLDKANITRCKNAAFGDFQCINAIAIANYVKKIENYKGMLSPSTYLSLNQKPLFNNMWLI